MRWPSVRKGEDRARGSCRLNYELSDARAAIRIVYLPASGYARGYARPRSFSEHDEIPLFPARDPRRAHGKWTTADISRRMVGRYALSYSRVTIARAFDAYQPTACIRDTLRLVRPFHRDLHGRFSRSQSRRTRVSRKFLASSAINHELRQKRNAREKRQREIRRGCPASIAHTLTITSFFFSRA